VVFTDVQITIRQRVAVLPVPGYWSQLRSYWLTQNRRCLWLVWRRVSRHRRWSVRDWRREQVEERNQNKPLARQPPWSVFTASQTDSGSGRPPPRPSPLFLPQQVGKQCSEVPDSLFLDGKLGRRHEQVNALGDLVYLQDTESNWLTQGRRWVCYLKPHVPCSNAKNYRKYDRKQIILSHMFPPSEMCFECRRCSMKNLFLKNHSLIGKRKKIISYLMKNVL
jgi:hypothetical protein